MKPALLIIDLQKAFYGAETKASMDGAAECINAALALFREKKLPIAWIHHTNDAGGPFPGQEGFEFIDALRPKDGETHITKKYGNAFNKTNCAAVLRAQSVDTVFVTGFCAEHCVLSTYRGAKDLDLDPVLIRGCSASDVPENIKFVESISEIVSVNILKKILENY
jgi:nicotinamidase-related amidase